MRFLFTTFEGGGHVAPALLVARRLRDTGHEVAFLSDAANRSQAEDAGLAFEPWRTAPNRVAMAQADDPLQDWKRRWPPAVVRAICDAVLARPALRYAQDTIGSIERFHPDAVISNELLFGAMMAAERCGLPLGLLTANVWCFPTRTDLPPFGPGFRPGGWFAARRDRNARAMIASWYDHALPDLNAARRAIGLPPLDRALDQLAAAKTIMLGTSQAFDFGEEPPPAPFAYAGPLGEVPNWARSAPIPDAIAAATAPIVLISFSTTFQGQAGAIARCVQALAGLPVQGVVTLGPAIPPGSVRAAPNVAVLTEASHDRLVPLAAAVIAHGGHGTVIRALMHGVPIVCMPMGRDHPENAARIIHHGAGLRLSRSASPRSIRAAVMRLLRQPEFARAAKLLGARIRAEGDGGRLAAKAFLGMAGSR
ncbi:glycosyltransferase [Plastoroseomonas hellenica]|uniref:glycosyltransferase n=1 Tax=Plastoroseomonas hellenica TaxID=2687306 RepID=UPI001BA4CE34|nr:glycosyltransferase [Plastoroseomonas hellenica]MBR0641273.1 glycosyltransferase family 1 protein [Plastoroseomonas hellenica]